MTHTLINSHATRSLIVVMPVFNDWESAQILITNIETAMRGMPLTIDIVAVDDCSTVPPPAQVQIDGTVSQVECVQLAGNVGHQRAIAIGLMHIVDRPDLDLVAVMDSDGEDTPEELRALTEQAMAGPPIALVAQRAERSEGFVFKLFYRIYIALFRLLTGHRISFGNFSVLPATHARRIIASQHIWNNFPATVLQSRLPVQYVPTRRGKRYAGESRMNFVNLVSHGLGAIAVFSDAVYIRILIASLGLFVVSIMMAGFALWVRLFTVLAIPAWATTVLGFALLVSIQAIMLPIMMAFLLLSNRATIQPLPRTIAMSMIAHCTILARGGAAGQSG